MLSFLRHPKTNAAANTSFNPNGKRIHKHAFLLLLPFFAILAQAPFVAVRGQQRGPILVVRVLPATICSSTNAALVNVVFIGAFYNEGNVFTALLSGPGILLDTIGTLNSAGGLLNILHAKIPANSPPGRYRIRVIASNPEQESENAALLTIVDSKAPALTLSKRDVSSCGDGSDGSITGVAAGGERPYTFRLLGGFGNREPTTDTSLTVNNLAPLNNYTMRVTDGNGCIVQADTDLVQLPAPSIEISTQGNESACGTDNGFFTLRVFPRTGIIATAIKPYSFQMSEQGDSAGVAYEEQNPVVRFDGLSDGSSYMVTMKDGAGCPSNTIDDIEIKKDTAIAVRVGSFQKPGCGASDGQMVVFANYGSHNSYRYSLSGTATRQPQSGHRFTGLAAGDYVLRARDSRGCEGTLNFTLPAPASCTTFIAGSTDAISITGKNALKLQALSNPSRTTFTLNLQGGSQENVQIIVTDMVGKKIYQTTGSSNRQYTFGQEFKSGIYIVQVIQGKQIQTLKLVKAN